MNDTVAALQERAGGALVREEFGTMQEVERRGETAAAVMAAQVKAAVEARYVIAMRRPRNWDDVRQAILKECRRPSFAMDKSALYRKPVGGGVEGLGIRFAEMAVRCMTNMLIESTMVYEDQEKEIHRVSVTDLEANNTWPLDIVVKRTVERAKPLDDGSYIRVRLNSKGDRVYTVPATDDDLLNKRAAQISKAIRNLVTRQVPGDIQDEAEAIIRKIRKDTAAKDPDAESKAIADGFAQMNVKPSQLSEYLGHSYSECTPAELVELRGLYGALRDGETSWRSIMESKPDQQKSPRTDKKTGTGGETWPKLIAGRGWVDVNDRTWNEDEHQGPPRGESRPPVTAEGAFKGKPGRKPTPPSPQAEPTMPLVSERETQALAWIAAAMDLQTIDDVEDEVRDEADDVRERVAKAAEARRRQLAG